MSVTVKISRSEKQWVAEVPKAGGFMAWSPSLSRLRRQVDRGLKEFYPRLWKQERKEIFELPAGERALLREVLKAERDAERAHLRADALKRRATRRLRSSLGISVREVGALIGVSGARAQQLLRR
jgi:hypothetical protein